MRVRERFASDVSRVRKLRLGSTFFNHPLFVFNQNTANVDYAASLFEERALIRCFNLAWIFTK